MQLRKHMPDFALYRNKEEKNYALYAAEFVEMCKNFKDMKCFLHQDYKLVAELDANGVHLTSEQFDAIPKAKELGLEVIISTHTHDEVHIAEAMGADYVAYSPIFETPNKDEPKGVDDLREIIGMTDIKVFALGGILTQEQVDAVEEAGAYGFASIRYFN
ncbi:thiamine phosphate synthase [Sulfurimonas paralvinellae]|uniref:Thiamine phosphate synthase n=1 Tax=Sulfurimonas paralvinellae TaxID=317658 RepID=A0A7M1BAI2_9BACT|nr:thiamine phosphate synthase [Sulfurimonas paralvinellae]QOP46729.1 thiamine phosphate synthase [Sulfurimonas paralvinellae]